MDFYAYCHRDLWFHQCSLISMTWSGLSIGWTTQVPAPPPGTPSSCCWWADQLRTKDINPHKGTCSLLILHDHWCYVQSIRLLLQKKLIDIPKQIDCFFHGTQCRHIASIQSIRLQPFFSVQTFNFHITTVPVTWKGVFATPLWTGTTCGHPLHKWASLSPSNWSILNF